MIYITKINMNRLSTIYSYLFITLLRQLRKICLLIAWQPKMARLSIREDRDEFMWKSIFRKRWLVTQKSQFCSNLLIYIPVINLHSRQSAIFTCDVFWRNWNFFYYLILPAFVFLVPVISSHSCQKPELWVVLHLCILRYPFKYVYEVGYNIYFPFIHTVPPQVRLLYFSIQSL